MSRSVLAPSVLTPGGLDTHSERIHIGVHGRYENFAVFNEGA